MKQNTCSFIKPFQDQYLTYVKHTTKWNSFTFAKNNIHILLGKSKSHHGFNALCQSNLHAITYEIWI